MLTIFVLPKTLIEYDSSSKTGRLSFVSVMETVIVAVDDLFDVPDSSAITFGERKIIFYLSYDHFAELSIPGTLGIFTRK